jgi:hypothetical protein
MQVGPENYPLWQRGILCRSRKNIKRKDFGQVHESYRRFHPAFVERW